MSWHIFCHFYAFDAFNMYHFVYFSCISDFSHYFLEKFAPIMSYEILLISCDYWIKLQNIVWIQKKRYRWGVSTTIFSGFGEPIEDQKNTSKSKAGRLKYDEEERKVEE